MLLTITSSKHSSLLAQERFIRPLSFLEGLPTQTIYDIHQDPKGYLYLGTDIGVYKYNGQSFSKLPTPESWDNNFDNLFHDESGVIWVKNFANQIFKEENGALRLIPEIQDLIKPLGGLKKFTIQSDSLFAALDNTLISIDLNTFNPRFILKSQGPENTFFSLQKYNKDVFFNNFKTIFDSNGSSSFSSPKGSKVLEFTFFKGNPYGLNRSFEGEIFQMTSGKMIDKSRLPEGTYLYFFREINDALYICTNKGLFGIDVEKNTITHSILEGKRVSDVIVDREGNLWISTLDDGLFFIANAPLYTTELINFRETTRNNILSLALTNDQKILAGNNKGNIFRVTSEGRIIQTYSSELQNEVEFIYFDELKGKVFYTQGYFDYPLGKKSKEIYFSKKMMPDDAGNFLIATSVSSGLIANDLTSIPSVSFNNSLPLTIFSTTAIPYYDLVDKRAKSAYFSKKYQRYYIGSSEGLFAFSKDGTMSAISISDSSPLIVNSMTEDANGTIWIGTQQKGLIALRGETIEEAVSVIFEEAASPVKKVIYKDENIYFIGGNQLYKYHIPSKNMQLLPISFMFKGININDLLLSEDKLWLATSEGLLWTNIKESIQFPEPLIYLQQVNSTNGIISLDEKLPYDIENLELQFDVLHFKSMGAYNLQFRINSNQDNWQTIGRGQQSIFFAGLNPGNYQLEVRAVIGGNISTSILVNFVVETPFWKTWWFMVLVVFLIILGSVAYVVNYSKRLQEKETIKSKLLQSQLTALRSQMNPHFLFNVINAVQGLIFANKKADAAEYLGEFSNLMRKVLQQSDKQFVRLEEEIQLIDLYISIEKRRFEEDFQYILEIDHHLDKNSIQIPSLIVQPFVENAIKHGLLHQIGERKLSLTFGMDEDEKHVKITIEDNGVGRKTSTEINSKRNSHQAFATKAIETRVNLLNQSLADPITCSIEDLINEQGAGIGTRVTLRLPFTYEYSHTS
ncbi:sensor histidine kinase [Mongoliitalea daihaiensis]|uniref:sensor histidine kinase n=1 Tax=Mongoliitalea daihaiensis TaxID=2782006 RepID=UPI001F398F3F|nr:histidine kinase [Mongoliitalea daihaiensis]UJP64629.1 histidine kinase [Mongoliitalea daihaiensis]